mgnify:CR=1 FL=1
MRYKIYFRSSTADQELEKLLEGIQVSAPATSPPAIGSPVVQTPLSKGEMRLSEIHDAEMQMLEMKHKFGDQVFKDMIVNIWRKDNESKRIRRISKESESGSSATGNSKRELGSPSGINKDPTDPSSEKKSENTTSIPGSSGEVTAVVERVRPLPPTNADHGQSPVSDTPHLPRFL